MQFNTGVILRNCTHIDENKAHGAITIRFNVSIIFSLFSKQFIYWVRIKRTPFNSEIEFQIHLIHIIVRKNGFPFPKIRKKDLLSPIAKHTHTVRMLLLANIRGKSVRSQRTNAMKFWWNKNDDFSHYHITLEHVVRLFVRSLFHSLSVCLSVEIESIMKIHLWNVMKIGCGTLSEIQFTVKYFEMILNWFFFRLVFNFPNLINR